MSEAQAKSPLLYLLVTCGSLVQAGLIAAAVFPIMPEGGRGWPIALGTSEYFFGQGVWARLVVATVIGLLALAFSWAALRRPAAWPMKLGALVGWAVATVVLWGSLSLTGALPMLVAFWALLFPGPSAQPAPGAPRAASALAPSSGEHHSAKDASGRGGSPVSRAYSPHGSLDDIDIVLEPVPRPRSSSPLPGKCPGCGVELEPGDDFCPRCGRRIPRPMDSGGASR